MDAITPIALFNGAAAIGFAALWWRDRKLVQIAQLGRDMAERAREKAEAAAGEQRAEIVSLNVTVKSLEEQIRADGRQLSQLRETGRKAAETIAELQPLADRERKAQAQRVRASQAAAAKRHAEAEAKKAAAK